MSAEARRPFWATRAFAAYVALDVLCTGAGMGVPIFCILLGFPTGWYAARRAAACEADAMAVLRVLHRWCLLAAGVTFVLMLALWGRWLPAAFDTHTDFVRTGIPLWLYEPRASFVGWLVLMIAVSPFLQLLAAVFGGHVALLLGRRAAP